MRLGRNAPCPCGSGKKFKKCCQRRAPIASPPQLSPQAIVKLLQTLQDEADRKETYGHVQPIKTASVEGHRIVAFGNTVATGTWKTFGDFLKDYLVEKLTSSWGTPEIQTKALEDRHPVLQWYDALCEFQKRNLHTANEDGIFHAEPDGPTLAYYLLAYDLFQLAENAGVQAKFLDRLRDPVQFQGARYELAVAAHLVRAGFSIELEDESDRSRVHPEFFAVYRATGIRFAVEAKSRHRSGILGFKGAATDASSEADVRRLLNSAIRKARKLADPAIIFLDLNLPPAETEAKGVQDLPWFAEVSNEVTRRDTGSPMPYHAVIFTNQSLYFGARGLPVPGHSIIGLMAQNGEKPVSSDRPFRAILDASDQFGRVPTTFPGDS